jgi:hypothetical protein
MSNFSDGRAPVNAADFTAATGAKPSADPRRWRALILLCAAQFMVVLDASIVNVALPSIKTALHFSESNLPWVVNAYTLTFGGFLLLGAVRPTCLAGGGCLWSAWPCSRPRPWRAAWRSPKRG